MSLRPYTLKYEHITERPLSCLIPRKNNQNQQNFEVTSIYLPQHGDTSASITLRKLTAPVMRQFILCHTVPFQPPMEAHGLVPYLAITFKDEQLPKSNQKIALLSLASSHSTMELSTYKLLFPQHSAKDDEKNHDYSILTNPFKEYSIMSYKLIECTFYVSNETDSFPLTTLFYVINDTLREPPDIVLGCNILQNPSIHSIAQSGMHLTDKAKSFIPFYHISLTASKHTSTLYKMQSPYKATVKTIPTRSYQHQQIQQTNTNDLQHQTTSPNLQPIDYNDQIHYGKTNPIYLHN